MNASTNTTSNFSNTLDKCFPTKEVFDTLYSITTDPVEDPVLDTVWQFSLHDLSSDIQFSLSFSATIDISDSDSEEDMDIVEYLHLYDSPEMECQGAGSSKASSNTQMNGNMGTVNYNYYANQYQNSMDLSGHAQNNGEMKNPMNTLNSLVETAGNIAQGMLLDQDTEETTQLGDRVTSDISGNTAINTQTSVGKLLGYARTLWTTKDPTSCADRPTKDVQAVDRWYTKKVASWDTTKKTYSFIPIDLPRDLLRFFDTGVFKEMTNRHFTLKCGWKVQVQCNTSAFHSGSLLVFMAPEFTACLGERYHETGESFGQWYDFEAHRDHLYRGNDFPQKAFTPNLQDQAIISSSCFTCPEQWTVFPHQVLNCRTNSSVDIEVPFVNLVSTSDPLVHSSWTLVIAVLTPLQYATGSAPSVEITVSIQPVDPVWNGLRYPQPAIQAPIPSQPRENSQMFLSTVPDNSVPAYGNEVNPPRGYLPGRFRDLLQLARIPTMFSIGTITEEKPYFSVNTTYTDAPHLTVPVTLSALDTRNTMVAGLARSFANYRGSLEVHLLFTGPAMARGKFLLAYSPPNGDPPETLAQAQQCTYMIWDIGLQSSVCFVIPFISVSDFRFNNGEIATALNVDGYFTVFSLTPLTYPAGVVPAADIVCFLAAGKDFSFRNIISNFTSEPQGVTENLETGHVEDQDATNNIIGESLPMHTLHSNIKFYYDRFVQIGLIRALSGEFIGKKVGSTNYSGNVVPANVRDPVNVYFCELTPLPSIGPYVVPGYMTGKSNQVIDHPQTRLDLACNGDRLFFLNSPFTYFHCDLEVMVKPRSGAVTKTYSVVWTPPGARLSNNYFKTSNGFVIVNMAGRNPYTYSPNPQGFVTFTIPYCTVTSTMSTTFNGFSAYGRSGWLNVAPGSTFGTISVYQFDNPLINPWTDFPSYIFEVYVRYKNMKVFCPRPLPHVPRPTGRNGRSVEPVSGSIRSYDEEDVTVFLCRKKLMESGDVETNPGPTLTQVYFTLNNVRYKLKFILLCSNFFGVDCMLLHYELYEIVHNWDDSELLLLSGDIESNPGPFDEVILASALLYHILFFSSALLAVYVWDSSDLLLQSGDVELNPGPFFQDFIFCLRNPETRPFLVRKIIELSVALVALGLSVDEILHIFYTWDSSDLMLLSGDVELNPGPFFFQPQGPKTKPKVSRHDDTIGEQHIRAVLGFLDADSSAETVVKGWEAVQALQAMWRKAKEAVHDKSFWVKFIKKLTKLFCGFWAFARSQRWDVKLALSIAWAVDFFSDDGIIGWMKKKLQKVFKSPPPPLPEELAVLETEAEVAETSKASEVKEESAARKKLKKLKNLFKKKDQEHVYEEMASQGPMDYIKDTNIVMTLMKNVDWLIKLVKSLISWITSWFVQEEERDDVKLANMLESFADKAAQIDRYRRGAAIYPGEDPYKFMDELYSLATKMGRTNIAGLADKFRLRNDHASARVEPIVIVLRGKPGAGKSVCAQILAQAISKLVTGKQSVYSLPPDSAYFDGYENQFCVIMDDLGQNPDGKDFAVFCQMVSTTNFLPPMAAVENKGTPFTSQVIIVTTNLTEFRPVTVSDPGAVSRRLTFEFNVVPSTDYTTASGRLDIEAALRETGPGYGPYSFNCPLLSEALNFCPRASRIFDRPDPISLEEVVNVVTSELDKKRATTNTLRKLVAQSPGEEIEMDRFTDDATRQEIAEVVEESIQIMESKAEWLQISGIILGASAAIAALGALIYKFFFSKDKEETKETKSPEEVQTPYDGKAMAKKTPKELVVLDVNSPNPTFDFEAFICNKMVHQIGFYFPDSVAPGVQSALAVKNRCFLVNKHIFENPNWTHFSINGMMVERDVGYKVVGFKRSGKSVDMVLVALDSGPQFKDCLSKFVPDKFDLAPNSDIIGISKMNGNFFFSGKYIGLASSIVTTVEEYSNMFRYKCNTFKGWCGSALVAQVGTKRCVIGLHSAGACGVAGGTIVTQSMLRKALETLDQETMEPQGALVELEKGPCVFVPRRSTLKKTFAHEIFKPKAGPAALSNKDPRLADGVKLDEVVWSKHTVDTKEYPEIFRVMAKEYANLVFSELGNDNGPLDLETVIKGMPGLDKMDPSTSPGLPYTQYHQRRKDLIDFDLGLIVDAELAREFKRFQDNDYSGHVYQSFLKDEIRPIEKVVAGKTRVVDVASVGHCMRGRQLLGKFASKFQTNPGITLGSAIGCDPDIFWTKIASDLGAFKNVYDVDYKCFDSSHGSGMFEILADCFFTKENGFDSQGVRAYLRSLAYSTHAYDDRRFQITGGLPSGCSSTSLINTVINNIVIRSILAMTYKNFEFDDIKILAYGDDLLVASNLQIDFNLAVEKGKQVGYHMTPASKAGTFPLTSSLFDCTFLKRSFEPDSENEFLIRPVMSSENLETMLSYYRPGTLRERLESICMLAMHSGPEEYNRLFNPYRDAGFYIHSWGYMDWCWRRKFT